MAAAKGITTTRAPASAGVEGRGAELVVLLLFLGVGQDLVGGLDVSELILRLGVLVRVRVELLGETVVGLLDLGGGGTLADAEGPVGILYGCTGGRCCVEGLRVEWVDG